MTANKIALLSSDKVLGTVGGGLAVASLGFGVYMNTHGPAPGGFGASGHFTVFAQLAPQNRPSTKSKAAPPTPAPPQAGDDLDMTATASIPKPETKPASGPLPIPSSGDDGEIYPEEAAIIASVTLEAAEADRATIAVGGRVRTVRVGDKVPGAGEVLAIRLGRYPALKTSRGYILAARQD